MAASEMAPSGGREGAPARLVALALLVALSAGALWLKGAGGGRGGAGHDAAPEAALPPPTGRPRLLELGSDTCPPCRRMLPIVEELRRELAGRIEVLFVDVFERRGVARALEVRLIPTQIFFDGEGRELFRHRGYLSREAILERWRELGVETALPLAPAGEPPKDSKGG